MFHSMGLSVNSKVKFESKTARTTSEQVKVFRIRTLDDADESTYSFPFRRT